MRYDFNGNLTNLVDTLLRTNRWTYDANDRNTETLDADGLRLARGVGLAGDMGTLVAVTHHAGSTMNGEFYAQHNHRGDITLTRAGTATVGRYGYSAFGISHSALGPDVCRFKFSSKERDAATGFSYYGYRFYAPQWQRWPNPDPIGEPGFETLRGRTPSPLAGGPNRYLFLGNNPVNRVDPLGLDFVPILPNFDPLGSLGEVFESLGDFWYAYKDMREANTKGADKYFHCLANCRASRKGPGVPLFVSFGREVVDTITHINHPIDSIKDSMEDMKANKHGWSCPKDESCESRCAKYRPRGLSGKY